MNELDLAAKRLDKWFEDCPGAAVAFSGGVDSALVVFWSRRILGRGLASAWIADSPSLKQGDLELARVFCATHDVELHEFKTKEVDDSDYSKNTPRRCFYCKKLLYETLTFELSRYPIKFWICSGANVDDYSEYRPGHVAAEQAGVRHPLYECGIGKELVRKLAKEQGLSLWDKPASPCLSSRIPYGQPVTIEKLQRIGAAEEWLYKQGFIICRVRHDGNLARVEVPSDRIEDLSYIWTELLKNFQALGFADVELDREGFVSGKLNRALPSFNAG